MNACPFCGGIPAINIWPCRGMGGFLGYKGRVYCEDCHARIEYEPPEDAESEYVASSKELSQILEDLWNRRTTAVATFGEARRSERGFVTVRFEDSRGRVCSIGQSSAIGDYDNSLDCPGSSFLWLTVAEDAAHLDREQVAGLVSRMQQWLATHTFPVEDTTTDEKP